MMVCIFDPLNLLHSIFCQIPGVKYLYFGTFKSLYYSKCFQEHHQEGDSLKNTVPVIIQQINLICSARHMNFTSDSRIQTKTSKTSLSRLFAVCIHFIFNFLFMTNLKKTCSRCFWLYVQQNRLRFKVKCRIHWSESAGVEFGFTLFLVYDRDSSFKNIILS